MNGWGLFQRTQTPPRLNRYQDYKPYLRIDSHQCAYCRITERRWGSDRNFVVEHFRPQKKFPTLVYTYSNLYYACNRCNDFKGQTWPTPALKKKGYFFTDPCQSDVYREHLRVQKSGRVTPLTYCGEYTLEKLHLNRKLLVTWRAERLELLSDIRSANRAINILEKLAILDDESRVQLQLLIDRHRELCKRLLSE